MATTDVSLVNPTPQNGVISAINDLAGSIGNIANTGVGIYSSFINAKTAAALAKTQAAAPNYASTQQEFLEAQKRTNFLVYAGMGVALIGTLALIYKAVK